MKTMKKLLALLLAGLMLLSLAACGGGKAAATPREQTARWLEKHTKSPAWGSLGGEWLMLAMSRGECLPEGWAESYYQSVEQKLADCGGVLDARKYTEYSRTILALTALGKDPANVAGYNLLQPLADFDQTNFQGLNGTAYALLALDSGKYEIPACPEGKYQASREEYVQLLLDREAEGGGWSLMNGPAEPDGTVMILLALAPYRQQPEVQAAVERGLAYLSSVQDAQGGFGDSCESAAQAVIALTALGVSLEDERFQKNGRGFDDRLMDFSTGDGGFCHAAGLEANTMATEQAFCALTALWRQEQGLSHLYAMKE